MKNLSIYEMVVAAKPRSDHSSKDAGLRLYDPVAYETFAAICEKEIEWELFDTLKAGRSRFLKFGY